MSVGDAMRDLDNRDLITGDFLVMTGDVISNLSIEPALAMHRARREKNKDAIMTMLLREAGTGHRTKSRSSRPVFIIDPVADRCLHYEEMGDRNGTQRYLSVDPALLTSHGEIEVREDLIDCHIDICTLDVLAQWSDNFDFQSLRKSFLRGVLKDYETYGKTIHTHIVTDQYAVRVKSLRAYDAISKDVMSRWSYPLCPDSNIILDQSYRFGRGQVYQENGVTMGRTPVVRKSVLGGQTSMADDVVVNGSTVGRRCEIGNNVTIDRAYIWDDVAIGDGSIIRQAIIASGSTIGKSCVIEPGALVSFGVMLADNTIVSARSRMTRDHENENTNNLDQGESDASSVASSNLVYRHTSASNSASSISTLATSGADSEAPRDSSRRSSFASDPSDGAADTRDFHVEATSSILDGLQKDDPADTIILELNGYRMSTNASQHEVRKAVVAAFMKRISNLVGRDTGSAPGGMSMREAVKTVFNKYQALVERTMFDKDAEEKVDQVDFLILVQKEILERPNADQLLLFVAKEVSDLEIVAEEGLLQWWDDDRSGEGQLGNMRGLAEQFITFLKDADENEESEEEDADDDDENDDED